MCVSPSGRLESLYKKEQPEQTQTQTLQREAEVKTAPVKKCLFQVLRNGGLQMLSFQPNNSLVADFTFFFTF